MINTLGIWLEAIATLAMLSYIYAENKFFRVFEHIFVGMAAAHAVVMGYVNVVGMAVKPCISGKWWLIIPLLMGLLLYGRFFKGWGWLSRIPLGFTMGVGAGLSIRGAIGANFIEQISATMLPLNSVNNVLFVLGVISTIMYFAYLRGSQDIPVVRIGGQLGRSVMMVAFGASFGYTVMARMSLLIDRLQFLFGSWIPLMKVR